MTTISPLGWRATMLWMAAAITSFHLAYSVLSLGFFIAGFIYAVLVLTRQPTSRRAFYVGLATAMLVYAPQLGFFFTIFGFAAVVLWLVLAFWVALFFLIARNARLSLKPIWFVPVVALVWIGLEYSRSELYYLRFSWVNAGYAFANSPPVWPLKILGGYGLGFCLMLVSAAVELLFRRFTPLIGFILLSLFAAALQVMPRISRSLATTPHFEVAGVQLEFPSESQVTNALDTALRTHPGAGLFVLSEYTFDGPPPKSARDWCRRHQRHLIVGGKQPAGDDQFYNTVFVLDPTGEVVFQQAKSVPIQFFKDGLPASRQEVWASPWGKLGICICYDLSYTGVTDGLVRQGAQALIVPTMDVADWGRAQHELHARVAPTRAAEYGIPIFRVASSGISQLVDAQGREKATAQYPGEEAVIGGLISLGSPGALPIDRWLVWIAVTVTAGLTCWLLWRQLRRKPHKPGPGPATNDPQSPVQKS